MLEPTIIWFVLSVVFVAVIAGLWIWHRREIRRKNDGIARQIFHERALEEKIKQERIKSETLMRVIRELRDRHKLST